MVWDGMVFCYDDLIWGVIFLFNGWKCFCGVIMFSVVGLCCLGKDVLDIVLMFKMCCVKDLIMGEMVCVFEGIDFGWGYQSGDIWECGIVLCEL